MYAGEPDRIPDRSNCIDQFYFRSSGLKKHVFLPRQCSDPTIVMLDLYTGALQGQCKLIKIGGELLQWCHFTFEDVDPSAFLDGCFSGDLVGALAVWLSRSHP